MSPFECRLQVLDQESRHLHSYLEPGDYCLYIGDYTSRTGWGHGPINQLISNLKKAPHIRETNPAEYKWKINAINKIANCFKKTIKPEHLENSLTLVPIPPSKVITNHNYDDRMLKICQQMVVGLLNPDVSQLIEAITDTDPTHLDEHKPTPDELMENYQIVCPDGYSPREHIILLDDLLTTGSHFKACQRMLVNSFPGVNVHGLFVARRVFPEFEWELD